MASTARRNSGPRLSIWRRTASASIRRTSRAASSDMGRILRPPCGARFHGGAPRVRYHRRGMTLTQYVLDYGLPLVFVFVLLEQLGAPVPSLTVLIVVGALSVDRGLPAWPALLVAVARVGPRGCRLVCARPRAGAPDPEDVLRDLALARLLRAADRDRCSSAGACRRCSSRSSFPGFSTVAPPMAGAIGSALLAVSSLRHGRRGDLGRRRRGGGHDVPSRHRPRAGASGVARQRRARDPRARRSRCSSPPSGGSGGASTSCLRMARITAEDLCTPDRRGKEPDRRGRADRGRALADPRRIPGSGRDDRRPGRRARRRPAARPGDHPLLHVTQRSLGRPCGAHADRQGIHDGPAARRRARGLDRGGLSDRGRAADRDPAGDRPETLGPGLRADPQERAQQRRHQLHVELRRAVGERLLRIVVDFEEEAVDAARGRRGPRQDRGVLLEAAGLLAAARAAGASA